MEIQLSKQGKVQFVDMTTEEALDMIARLSYLVGASVRSPNVDHSATTSYIQTGGPNNRPISGAVTWSVKREA